MKKIFITIPWFYPAYKAGGPVLSIVNLIQELNEGYEFAVFTSHSDLNSEALRGIKLNQWQQYNPYTKVWYAENGNRSNDLLQQVKIINPDLIYIIGLYSWHFNIVPLFFCKNYKKILSVRGMLHPGALTQKKLKKQLFLNAFKLSQKDKNICFHATDALEKEYIENKFGSGSLVKIAANIPRSILKRKHSNKEEGQLHLITIALISPMKNHLLVLQSLAMCKEEIRYSIYGPVKDPLYWQQCVELIERLPSNIKVRYYGDIQPQLIPEKLYDADVFIMPSKSENYGHSIIEALSAGLPVITSEFTPWNELAKNKAGLNVALSELSLMEAIHFFSSLDKTIYLEWSDSAAVYAAKRVDIQALKNEYELLFS